jgi:hypothetical protein
VTEISFRSRDQHHFVFSWEHEFDYSVPEVAADDGLLACFLAEMDKQGRSTSFKQTHSLFSTGVPTRMGVLDYLMTSIQIEDPILDLKDCFSSLGTTPKPKTTTLTSFAVGGMDGKDLQKDLLALCQSLRYSRLFDQVSCLVLPPSSYRPALGGGDGSQTLGSRHRGRGAAAGGERLLNSPP